MQRAFLACGVLAPVAFIGGWLVSGLRSESYSPISQPISELARDGAATQPLMTGALVVFGLLLPFYAKALGEELGSDTLRKAATAAGVTTLGVALFPLSEGDGRNAAHAAFAGAGYAAMALSPLLGGRVLPGRWGGVSTGISAASATCLVASVVGPDELTGLLQRTGLTLVDLWFAAVAVVLLRRR